MTTPDELQPELLPLAGRQLIEASAGTGKTFNITRIYLRLLLERGLEVQQILVMTFSRAATEELRGRIAQELRSALEHWDELPDTEPFYQYLTQQVKRDKALRTLENALLHMDEASIHTIHGFCKRVLTRQAFSSGLDFNLTMEADTALLVLEAVRDWYRGLAYREAEYALVSNSWPTPDEFYAAFRSLFSTTSTVECRTPDRMKQDFLDAKQAEHAHLSREESAIAKILIEPHKDRNKRLDEWDQLMSWLATNEVGAIPEEARAFLHAGRFPKAQKEWLMDCFAGIKQLDGTAKTIGAQFEKARAMEIAVAGIQFIRQATTIAKLSRRVMNFDDLVLRLAASLRGPGGEALAEALRGEFPVALVDEFQDTDPDQYAILDHIYPRGGEGALFMIGDPKQAIYGFRGGDVFAYLQARELADRQWWMGTNWRSSSAMVAGYNRLFSGAPVGEPSRDIFQFGIDYHRVAASSKADEKPLHDSDGETALQLVHFPFDQNYKYTGQEGRMRQDFREVIAAWCVGEVARLLNKGVCIGEESLHARDIAILVRDRTESEEMRAAVVACGLSCVYLSAHDNLFRSEEAMELLCLLQGIADLESGRLMAAALSTRYLGCDAQTLARMQIDEATWEGQAQRLQALRDLWLRHGFMAMGLELLHRHASPDPDNHDRFLTNAIHLFELLQQASQQHRQPAQLLQWLQEQIAADTSPEEAELRLESDANLIRIVTQHGAKGLEYPIVFIPFACRYREPNKRSNKTDDLLVFHDPETYTKRYFLGEDAEIMRRAQAEGHAESIRLLYVAVTRARLRCYLCVAPLQGVESSPLGLVMGLEQGAELGPVLKGLQADAEARIGLQEVAQEVPAERVELPIAAELAGDIAPARFTGRIERNWTLSSFSGLTQELPHSGISSPDHDQFQAVEEILTEESEKLRFTLPKGAAAGDLLHSILELTDFSQPDWRSVLQKPLDRFGGLPTGQDTLALTDWLDECLQAPLAEGLCLAELPLHDTLRETEFYFPLNDLRAEHLRALLAAHRGGADGIALPDLGELQGMMHGYIDLIFHWRGRYYVADYKSTHLGGSLMDYREERLRENVRANYYDLQYLIYSLALHRYLGQRLSGYDPAVHLGGVYYLYLRGMHPTGRTGVYHSPMSPDLVQQLEVIFGTAPDV